MEALIIFRSLCAAVAKVRGEGMSVWRGKCVCVGKLVRGARVEGVVNKAELGIRIWETCERIESRGWVLWEILYMRNLTAYNVNVSWRWRVFHSVSPRGKLAWVAGKGWSKANNALIHTHAMSPKAQVHL